MLTRFYFHFRSHPHNLVGDECSQGVMKVEFKTAASNPTVISFPHIGIQCSKKDDVPNRLQLRESIKVDPFQSTYIVY